MAEQRPERPPPGPFSFVGSHKESDKQAFAAALARGNVRLLPYPFDAALAVASDVDHANRASYDAYVGSMVGKYGLDFGDSIWLHWRYPIREGRTANSRGFYSPNLTFGREEPKASYDLVPTFIEAVSQYHAGNVDHFHALLPSGPRGTVLTEFVRGAGSLTSDVPVPNRMGRWRGEDSHVFAIEMQPGERASAGLVKVSLECHDGEIYDSFEAEGLTSCTERPIRFLTMPAVDSAAKVPELRRVARVVVESDDERLLDTIDHLILYTVSRRILLDRLDVLRSDYGVSFNLVTEHAALHFRNPLGALRIDPLNTERFAGVDNAGSAYYGRLTDDQGRLILSTDADDPDSAVRVLPEMVDELDLRFIVPMPAISAVGLDIFELLNPSSTRSGGGVYCANRVQPNVSEPITGKFDGKTRHDTFTARIDKAIALAAGMPGTFWPIYTHLGGYTANPDGTLPAPYFDDAPMRRLQRSVFGFGDARSRLWFTRASVLYDYALMVRSIASSITRVGDQIRIASWYDATLGYRLPVADQQLYGITFYVDDARSAAVFLDETEIPDIARNGPDKTGRPSVTIFSSGLEHVVFSKLDPNTPKGAALSSGQWAWSAESGGERSYGRLSCSGEAPGNLRLALLDAVPPGAQALRFRVRRGSAPTRSGIVLTNASGASFSFGDGGLSTHSGSTASYVTDPDPAAAGVWETIVVPFAALRWNAAATGVDMPSLELASISLLVEGGPKAFADFADVAFLRPRCVPGSSDGLVLVGNCDGRSEVSVVLATADEVRETKTDQLGWFVFTHLAAGIYDLWARDGDILFERRAGRRIEITHHRADVTLTAVADDRTDA